MRECFNRYGRNESVDLTILENFFKFAIFVRFIEFVSASSQFVKTLGKKGNFAKGFDEFGLLNGNDFAS